MPAVSPNSTQNQVSNNVFASKYCALTLIGLFAFVSYYFQPKPSNNVPYDPFIHTNNKPPLSFSSLIFLAIEDAKEKALPVKEIYAWIVKHYPYFKTAPTGWKNSVRHNLSLNKCFQKVEKAPVSIKSHILAQYKWRTENSYTQFWLGVITFIYTHL